MVDQANEAVQRIEAAVNLIGANEARLNITWGGQNGDLADPVSADATDGDIKRWATEAVRSGSVPGIPVDPNADFDDFVIDRFNPTDARPYRLLSLRAKTPFGRVRVRHYNSWISPQNHRFF